MTSKQYRAALERLGLTQEGAAQFFDAGSRTSRRWALGEARIPEAVAMTLRYMVKTGMSPDEFKQAASQ